MDFFKILVLVFLGMIVVNILFQDINLQPFFDGAGLAVEMFFSQPLLVGIVCFMLVLQGAFIFAKLVKSQAK